MKEEMTISRLKNENMTWKKREKEKYDNELNSIVSS